MNSFKIVRVRVKLVFIHAVFLNRRDEKRLGLDSKTLTESLRMSTQSDVERFIPGTNVVYDNEIYTRLFYIKERCQRSATE